MQFRINESINLQFPVVMPMLSWFVEWPRAHRVKVKNRLDPLPLDEIPLAEVFVPAVFSIAKSVRCISAKPLKTQSRAVVFAEHVMVRLVPATLDLSTTYAPKFGPFNESVLVIVWLSSSKHSHPGRQPVVENKVRELAASSVARLPPIAQFCPVAVTP
jgi:hypothetical protein